MKKLVATVAATAVLLVAAPVASAAGPPSNPPVQMSTVSCTLSNQYVTRSWSFQLPTMIVPYFEAALARIEQHYPALSCSIS